ncbi:GNAT family N-acetyltransferase [Sneathiella chinensis]|uniref:N-acetyltransferase GCN5 n=1 Tax=Sneathiella chinensis TaxID=349750 RepID=A0ABQ5U2C4_9PROT|nr:GNAT family N-acetyltransferase [Sneathiella chinensis]GLQ05487.1 N-acetyltransferase GCN5 [Sneathiella chinensis]
MPTASKVIVKTRRLVIREMGEQDAAFILFLLTQPSFLKYIGDRGVRDLESARLYIRDVRLQYQINGCGSYLVERKNDGVPVGISGLIRRKDLPHPDIGFAYDPAYWRQGFAFEGASALLSHARDRLGFETVIAVTSDQNTASQALLEKLGMRFQGRVRLGPKGEETRLYGPAHRE